MKKTITYSIAVVAMIAVTFAVGYLFNFLFPVLDKEYHNEALYRPWNDPLMFVYFLQPFMLTGALIWGWQRIKHLFKGSVSIKALNFTLIYFMVAIIPGMLMSLSSFKVSVLAIITWTISAFLQVLIPSMIFIRLQKESSH